MSASGQKKRLPRPLLDIAGHEGRYLDGEVFLKSQRDANEQNFYRIVESQIPEVTPTVLSALTWLRPYVPRYFGEREPTGEHISETGLAHLVLSNLFHPFQRPAVFDIKMQLSSKQTVLERTSAANLLGCYIHGVESEKLVFRNGFNEYKGVTKPVDYFYSVIQFFFSHCKVPEADRRKVIADLRDLCDVFARLCSLGFNFPSTSILFLYDQEAPYTASFALVDFEHVSYQGESLTNLLPRLSELPSYDAVAVPVLSSPPSFHSHPIAKSARIIFHAIREYLIPEEHAVTVYLVRHGERHDYTDFDWAPSSPHPHDAHLSSAGERQSQDFADRLRHAKLHRLASAPMQRAILGAEPIARATRQLISVEPGFCEFLCSKTRTRVPTFFSRDVSISPWIDHSYRPYWGKVELESWPDVFKRSALAVNGLVEECRVAHGDLVIISHRSTLQTVFKALLPDFEEDTMLEYGGIAMIAETFPGSGKFEMITFNELNHLRDNIKSPSSNPFRHIEGYYEDLSWSTYKSTAQMWAAPAASETEQTEQK